MASKFFKPDDIPAGLMKGAKPVSIRKASTVRNPDASEHVIQCATARFLDLAFEGLPGALWFAVPNGGKRHKTVAQKLKKEGVKAGVYDIYILYTSQTYFIEMKARRGSRSEEQKQFAEKAIAAGAICTVCRSVEQVEAFLREHGIPLKATTGKTFKDGAKNRNSKRAA